MEWTEGRRKSFITSVIRSGFRRWPPKFEVLKEAFTSQKKNEKTGRLAKHYKCKKCSGEFPQKEIQIDHIKPVVDPKIGFVNWDTFIERLFCNKKNLQVLCHTCHKAKTKKEKDIKTNASNKNSKTTKRG